MLWSESEGKYQQWKYCTRLIKRCVCQWTHKQSGWMWCDVSDASAASGFDATLSSLSNSHSESGPVSRRARTAALLGYHHFTSIPTIRQLGQICFLGRNHPSLLMQMCYMFVVSGFKIFRYIIFKPTFLEHTKISCAYLLMPCTK